MMKRDPDLLPTAAWRRICYCPWVGDCFRDDKMRVRQFIARHNGALSLQKRVAQFNARHNGAFLLQKRVQYPAATGKDNPIKIFSEEEIVKATKNYDHRRLIVMDGLGVSYFKGVVDGRGVTVKRMEINTFMPGQIERIMTEIVILSTINHRNLAKLLGCCLETERPVLVYEPFSNGSLEARIPTLPWLDRLRIATEVAEALNYLHTHSSMAIVHKNIKLRSIMLDEQLTAKISGFELLFPMPTDKTQAEGAVTGTGAYLDPEYIATGVHSEMIDVYSFGAVVGELLTGKEASKLRLSTGKEVHELLAQVSILSVDSRRAARILDPRVVQGGRTEQMQAFAEVAIKCFRQRAERPTMKEVVLELWRIQRM